MSEYGQYRPRLSIVISKEDQEKLRRLLPHGSQKMVFNLIISDLIELLETHGSGKIIGAFITRDITLKNILRMEI